jgi:hypothetical protein
MDAITLLHQGVLYGHVTAFAIAFSAVLREDLALLGARGLDLARLSRTARTLSLALAALWLTGMGLLTLEFGSDFERLFATPKPMAKLLVVTALTCNGLALHTWAFPGLRAGNRGTASLAVILGATSSVSWVYAAFMGVARIVAPSMSLADFMRAYGALLIVAVGGALVFIRPHLLRLMEQDPLRADAPKVPVRQAMAGGRSAA